MKAGDLDRRVTLRRLGPTAKSSFGTPAGQWFNLATRIAAAHQPVSDGERMRAQQAGATVTDRFRIRYAAQWADLSARDQLEFEGRLYDIVAVKPIGRREGLEVTAKAQADTTP